MYDARVGRWSTEDPLLFEAGDANLYRYVRNAPTIYTDSSGLVALFFDGAAQTEKDRTTIYRMYEASKDPNKQYVKSPVAWKNLKQFEDQAAASAKAILEACIKGLHFPKKALLQATSLSRRRNRCWNFGVSRWRLAAA